MTPAYSCPDSHGKKPARLKSFACFVVAGWCSAMIQKQILNVVTEAQYDLRAPLCCNCGLVHANMWLIQSYHVKLCGKALWLCPIRCGYCNSRSWLHSCTLSHAVTVQLHSNVCEILASMSLSLCLFLPTVFFSGPNVLYTGLWLTQ